MLFVRSILLVLLMSVISLNLVSCDKAKQMSIAGKYVSEKNPNRYRELKSDGTLFVQEGRAATGTYKVEDKQITVTLSTGDAGRSKLEGNVIIDNDGERFIKQ